MKERKRAGVLGERSAVWPFLVATSNFVFSWPANVAARGRTDSERNGTGERANGREKESVEESTRKKAAQKREKKLKVNYRRLAAAAPFTAAAAVVSPASE